MRIILDAFGDRIADDQIGSPEDNAGILLLQVVNDLLAKAALGGS
jgi:hypothetical protein